MGTSNISDTSVHSNTGRHYDYSPGHRALEIVAIALCLAMLGELSWRLIMAIVAEPGLGLMGWLVGAALMGYLCADLASGIVHWLADRFGSPETPILGQAFVHPFREHHTFPKKILEHDFIEVNGNNCVAMLLFLVPMQFVLPAALSGVYVGLASFTVTFSLGIFLTNQFHQWAHASEVGPLVAMLQRSRLVLSPEAHDRHHTLPYESDYCITSGWMNPLLERINLFGNIEKLLNHKGPEPYAAPTAEEQPSAE